MGSNPIRKDMEVNKRIQTITIKDGISHIVTYTASKLEFENYVDDVNKMIVLFV